ncbi:MAG: NUDIX pyrophosphatase [Oscillospiraceae bacterium]|nr:NUDIX pyrophosphatase [Oscillospiraceae bacterium]
MARLPYQVLVILYLRSGNRIRYCIFERESPKYQVQFIAGGGEDNETPLQAAIREVFEESGINNAKFQQLTSICYIPTNIFSESQRQIWGMDVFVIPEYSFGAEVKSESVNISNEHIGFKWVSYDEAINQLKWDSNKTALFELNCKLTMNES